jgi:hypothetical protein
MRKERRGEKEAKEKPVVLTGPTPWAIPGITQGDMNIVTKVQKWGNSQGLLAKQVLEEARIPVLR